MTPSSVLKQRLKQPDILVAPGVFDAFSAMAAAKAGFEALYVSGASIAYTRLGRPDIGLFGLEEVADVVSHISERVDLPLVVDADTGFGNALNVQRTVRLLERSGAAGIQIEDQAMPKRCGHLDGKALVSKSEMAGKIRAAVDARRDEATQIVARTDAIGVEGFEAALERAEAYRDAGADVLFVEAPRDEAEIAEVVKRFGADIPLLANMVEGGKTPAMTAEELQAAGFDIVIFPGGLMRALAVTITEYFQSLHANGSTKPFQDRMLDFRELNELLGTPGILEAGRKYDGENA
ncbi:MAG: isocitrate lyase/phosphoenolpyruvate mutase family protein [Nisaea sp.]|uniref:isocitrate lyase/PEP mutase family protein n=1 Tax=Nisaea sp. TaxID=2024842 RepID=UPI001AFE70C6|nr:isocitrate lyase/phosphoenolpyruvate mutase family protein [Nisaea sp.]MBO6561996.1 isocitrate lyase/phosphoenolpyruvate mutase family protein [Nisaea sp.]